MTELTTNTSGQGPNALLPAEIQTSGFNWGAFLLNWIWGVGNKSYITLTMFATILVAWIPVIGPLVPLGLSIWFGIKGNEWAWQNKHWESVEHFKSVQKTWTIWGCILFVLGIIMTILFFTLFGALLVMGGAANK